MRRTGARACVEHAFSSSPLLTCAALRAARRARRASSRADGSTGRGGSAKDGAEVEASIGRDERKKRGMGRVFVARRSLGLGSHSSICRARAPPVQHARARIATRPSPSAMIEVVLNDRLGKKVRVKCK